MTFSKVKTCFAACLTSGLLLTAATADAAKGDPRALGVFKDWSAYTWVENGQKICYMLSRPTKSLPKNVRRGDIYMMITYRPKARLKEEVSHVTGYPYKNKSVVDVTIDKQKFKMATDGDAAWLPGTDMDAKMVNAMRRGSKMSVDGISSRGTKTTDTYSLQGFTAAHKQIRKSCN
ncbi:hypothetical protein GUA87_06185 [Sneathiella sp. P13V-1]|uniref:invasion associated locus B family protein n=1 Tax=Sneathiella sp. P13V-1 TaxID=2697366 RepID=UPI00187BC05E|nr:invasion associated locus B family protein [Sneathiella sp. P13V-1]MBE7636427.1 hypothetical protein [Sneathiella sp. P13V-1]